MIRDAVLVLMKDLRIEARSRVITNQVVPFSLVVLILFAFAFNEFPQLLKETAPGLFWIATLFSLVIAVQRSAAIEVANRAKVTLLVSGADPAGVFLGKVVALVAEALALEIILALEVVVLYGATLRALPLLAISAVAATLGIAAIGVVVGAMVSSSARETLLPILVLPVIAPVLLSATVAWQDYLGSKIGSGTPWLGLLVLFAVVFTTVGALTYGTVLEE